MIIFIRPLRQEARAVKEILRLFGEASGLMTNLAKCSITPVFGGEDVLQDIVAILGCQVQQFPIRYLGLPLSSQSIPKAQLHSMVESVARKLPPCHGALMARSGRLVWIKSVLRAVPIYAMMADSLLPWARKEIDALCRRFLWAGKEASAQGRCMVAWSTACRPTTLGGLGISDLRLTGYALQTRWLWLQRTDSSRAWSELPLKIEPEVLAFFKASTFIELGNGNSALFWEDRWIQGQSVHDLAPNLLQLVSRRRRRTMTVREGLTNRQWTRAIARNMTIIIAAEYLDLWEATSDIILGNHQDKMIWRWTPDGQYTSKSAYMMMHTGSIRFRGHSMIWKTWAPLRVKIFLWLAFRRRHWTNDRRSRHGLEAREECYLCDQAAESIDHILCCCPFSRELWFNICQSLGRPMPDPKQTVILWWRALRVAWPREHRKGVDTLFALVSWRIWKERNARCFREAVSSVADLMTVIKAEGELWVQAGALGLGGLAPTG